MRGLATALALCALAVRHAGAQQPAPARPSAEQLRTQEEATRRSQPATTAPPAAATPQTAVDTAVLPPQEIGTIAVGQTKTGMLETGDYTMSDNTWCDIWYFTATAGQRVVVELRSRRFDAYLQLLDPFGGKLAENDDGGRGMERGDSRIEFAIREAGRYQIVVNNFGDSPREGVYTVTLR